MTPAEMAKQLREDAIKKYGYVPYGVATVAEKLDEMGDEV